MSSRLAHMSSRLAPVILTLSSWQLAAASVTSPESIFAAATEALDRGELQEAIEGYETLLAGHWHAAELYHNYGVARQRLGMPAQAAFQLYRAWLLDPFSGSARADFLTSAEKAEMPAARRTRAERQVTALAWRQPLAIGGMISFWLGLLASLVLRQPLVRGLGIAGIAIGLLFTAGAYYFHRQIPGARAAWAVAEESIPVFASHGEGTPRIGQLLPLTQVEVVSVRDGWAYVRGGQELSGWVEMSGLGKLRPWRG